MDPLNIFPVKRLSQESTQETVLTNAQINTRSVAASDTTNCKVFTDTNVIDLAGQMTVWFTDHVDAVIINIIGYSDATSFYSIVTYNP